MHFDGRFRFQAKTFLNFQSNFGFYSLGMSIGAGQGSRTQPSNRIRSVTGTARIKTTLSFSPFETDTADASGLFGFLFGR